MSEYLDSVVQQIRASVPLLLFFFPCLLLLFFLTCQVRFVCRIGYLPVRNPHIYMSIYINQLSRQEGTIPLEALFSKSLARM